MGASDAEAARVSGVPDKKPGKNKWRLVLDFRWLNSFCVKSKVKMETLKKLRRLAEPNHWCFSFDLQDGYHAVRIDPDFQKYMQFDLQWKLFQCTTLPLGWSDSPRILVKFMKVMVEALRLPGAAEDRRELLKLNDKWAATPRYEERRRAGGFHRDVRRRGPRVLPCMDDFLILTSTEKEAFVQQNRVRRVLARLGLSRKEKEEQWEPGQLIEHLSLEVDLKEGLFRVTETRVNKIDAQAKSTICDAAREKRWLSARWLASFNGLWQSIYLAVPAARLYLRGHTVLRADNQEELGGEAEVPAGTSLQIYWELDDAWYPGVVQLYDNDGFANIMYNDGSKEVMDEAEETFSIIYDVETPIGVTNFFSEKDILLTNSVRTSDPPVGTEENKINKPSFLE
ncbi:hypothetical protein CYMTET_56503 [Cymbomonas tetramitiformis]|uniref:Reverse transcriptase domain-containing protein n=1 Tax=Cymbomonas tetramitiformis TaxID=36881 RepID=A0AAE0ENP3_9CHLO|nr:hypothetical protein CYMTET_56503 [Cymbomonas tetramitiformis]